MYDPALFQRASVLEEERDFPCKDMIPGATHRPFGITLLPMQHPRMERYM